MLWPIWQSFWGILQQPGAKFPNSNDEIKPIEWGDLNFIHTTDTHGWLAGHLLEKQFSADWGDLISFAEQMRLNANDRGVDLLIIDTGDRHDGNGLSDASVPDSSLSLPIFCTLDYDLVTIGNHELYRGESSYQEYYNVKPKLGPKYLVSNVDILVGGEWVDMGNKYRIFQTPNQNQTILAFGFIFNFDRNDKSATRVIPVESEVQKPWFQDVLRNNLNTIDHIVLVSHIPVRDSPEFQTIVSEIRKYNQTIQIHAFGGHSHVRDFAKFDNYSYGLQSGRYGESIGWASYNFTSQAVNRSYLDFNSRALEYHGGYSGLSSLGAKASKRIAKVRERLNLDEKLAYVPETYYVDRRAYPSKHNIYSLLEERVLPLLTSPLEIHGENRYIFMNTGGIRFDLFKGDFTRDTGYIVSPFKNEWNYIKSVPEHIASQVISMLNGQEKVALAAKWMYTQMENDFKSENADHQSYGYRTCDDMDCEGDDTVHRPWRFHRVPNVIQSKSNVGGKMSTLVFHDFMLPFIETALSDLNYENFSVAHHGGETITELFAAYFPK